MTLLDHDRVASADPETSRVRWWRDHEGAAALLICVLAVLPTVVWGVVGAGYLTDDYWMALWLDESGVREGMRLIAFDRPGRPLAALYYVFSYQVLGEAMAAQVVVLVAVNAAMIDGLRRFGRLFLQPHRLFPALALFAVLANHSTTRFWFVVGTYPLAVALVAYAGVSMSRGRIAVPSVLLASALLLYEGVAGFCVVVLALVLWQGRRRFRDWLIPACVTLAATGFMYLNSPKAAGQQAGIYPRPFEFADTLVAGQFGAGLVGDRVLGQILVASLGCVVVIAIVLRWFPSFGRPGAFDAHVLTGVLFCLVCAGPMLVGGSVFATSGVNDRNNLVPSIGASLVLAAPLVLVGRHRPRAGFALIAAVVVGSTLLSMHDVRMFRASVVDGRAVEEAIATAIPEPSRFEQSLVLVQPALPGHEGVAPFIESYDIQGAMRLHRGGDWSFLRVHPSEVCGTDLPLHTLDWRAGTVTATAPESACPG